MAGVLDPAYLFLLAAFWQNRARIATRKLLLGTRLQTDPGCDLWSASLKLKGPGQLHCGPGCVIERSPFPCLLELEADARLELGPRVWIRGKYRPNLITCHAAARVRIGSDSLLNGVIITARNSVTIGDRANLAWDVAILDSDQHPLDNQTPMRVRPVTIGDHVWIGAGAIILPGAHVGSHSVVAAHSVVRGDFPPHSLIAGAPARQIKTIGDRDRV